MQQRLFWSPADVEKALLTFLDKHGPPLSSTRYRELRRLDPFTFPSHETVRKQCGSWVGVREQIEEKWAARQGEGLPLPLEELPT